MAELAVEDSGGVLRLTFNRPDRLTALTDEMTDGLAEHLERARTREDVRVVVLSGPAARVRRDQASRQRSDTRSPRKGLGAGTERADCAAADR